MIKNKTTQLIRGVGVLGFANNVDIGGGREAYFKNGSLRLVVIPEPATLGLFGGAFLGLFAFRRIFRA